MVFSSKLEADYAELANHYLDRIPIDNVECFAVVRKALSSIIHPNDGYQLSIELMDRVKGIKEIMDQPNLYVEDPCHDEIFKGIILARIAAKITEIDTLDSKNKEIYIEDQRQIKEKILQDAATIATRRRIKAEGNAVAQTIAISPVIRTQTQSRWRIFSRIGDMFAYKN